MLCSEFIGTLFIPEKKMLDCICSLVLHLSLNAKLTSKKLTTERFLSGLGIFCQVSNTLCHDLS